MVIKNIDVGNYVHGEYGYSRVNLCVHGRKFYSWVDANEIVEHDIDEISIIEVDDMDENHIPCCS